MSIDIIDGGTRVFAPQLLMTGGSTASVSKADAYEVTVSLPASSSSAAGPLPTHIVLRRAINGSWVELAARDVPVRLGDTATFTTPASPGARQGSGAALTLKVGVAASAATPTSTSAVRPACGT